MKEKLESVEGIEHALCQGRRVYVQLDNERREVQKVFRRWHKVPNCSTPTIEQRVHLKCIHKRWSAVLMDAGHCVLLGMVFAED